MKIQRIMLKKSQVESIEVILLLAMGLMIIYYIFSFTQGTKTQYEKTFYFYSQYIISEDVLNTYESLWLLKNQLKAKNLSYNIHLPERLFGTAYYIRNKTIQNTSFLIFYLPGSPYFFRISYGLNKSFNYLPGKNKILSTKK